MVEDIEGHCTIAFNSLGSSSKTVRWRWLRLGYNALVRTADKQVGSLGGVLQVNISLGGGEAKWT